MNPLERHRRRARDWGSDEEQIVNANDDAFDLTPVSQTPAEAVRAAWAALLPELPT